MAGLILANGGATAYHVAIWGTCSVAKKPIRVFKKSASGQLIPTVPAKVPVYGVGATGEQLIITQQVFDDPTAVAKEEPGADSRYTKLLHSIYDAVLITDLAGTIQEVNVRAEHHFLMERSQLVGQNIVSLIAGADQRLLDVIGRNVSEKKFTLLEAVCNRADGAPFAAEIAVNSINTGSQDEICFFVRDITTRKQMEKDLMAANEKLMASHQEQLRLEAISKLYYELNNPLQILMSMVELDKNESYQEQLDRIAAVLKEMRREVP